MKTANVVSVRYAGGDSSAPQAASSPIQRMSEALRRYPEISEEERQQLIQFFKHGAQEDIVQATYVVGLEPRLIAFQRDHPEHFRSGMKAWWPFALMVMVPVLFLLWRLLH